MTARFWLAYATASAVGLGVAYAALRLSVGAAFSGPVGRGLILSWVAPPMGGLAGFAVAFMPLAGRVLRGLFWILGSALVLSATALAYAAIFEGWAGPVAAMGVAALAVVGLGAVLFRFRGAVA